MLSDEGTLRPGGVSSTIQRHDLMSTRYYIYVLFRKICRIPRALMVCILINKHSVGRSSSDGLHRQDVVQRHGHKSSQQLPTRKRLLPYDPIGCLFAYDELVSTIQTKNTIVPLQILYKKYKKILGAFHARDAEI
jgi:hypothetical protein